ncbi:MAG: InlB B-repeat-containing protein [Clostridia bacterium]|nr:InlB B-repeat-containing protein [Clostridia bacterium]MBQ5792915.1 InlB B-repeat-containing protein [Clostridia bacterium]
MIQEQFFTLSFRPGKGEVSCRSLEVKVGEPLPALPIPQRKDYTFDGWYTEENGKGQKYVPGDVPTADLVLHAHWIKRKTAKKKSLYRTQKNAAIALAVSFALLIGVLIGVRALVSILTYNEQVKIVGENGEVEVISTKYYVKKIDGIYHLCHLNGSFPNFSFDPLPQDADGYFVTDHDSLIQVDPKTGACKVYAVVETEGTEVVGFSGRVMLFRQLTYDASSSLGKKPQNRIDKIEITNEHGSFTFIREQDTNNFYIDGYDTTAFSLESFAQLSSACGYTISMERLADPDREPDGTIRYAEYGLVAQTRKETLEDGTEREYEYKPATFTTTAGDGTSYTVIVGDPIVSGAGYYAQLQGRDKVYILSANGIKDYVLQPLEVLLTPMVSYPSSMNTYFDVEHFIIESDIDHEKINDIIFKEACKRLGIDPETVKPEEIDREELTKAYAEVSEEMYDELFKLYSRKVCDFSYLDLEERENTMYSSMSYKTDSEYMKGYFPNYDNVNTALYNLYSLAALRIIKLDPDADVMDEYGVLEPAHIISYYYDDVDEQGKTFTVFNRISISKKTTAGIYYAYGEIMAKNEDGEYVYVYTPMLVELYESAVPFLEWSDVDWYDSYFVQLNVAYVQDVIYSWGQNSIKFGIDNSATSQMTFLPGRGNGHTATVDGKELTYTIKQENGTYVLVDGEGNPLTPIQISDYMISAQYATKGKVQYPMSQQYARDYMFIETKTDESKGTYTYYMYFRADKAHGYALCADVKVLDASTGAIISANTVEGKAAYQTDYFYTKSGYLFMLDKNSSHGKQLTQGMGSWGNSTVYITADDQYILIDNGTGDWFTIKTLTPPIYFTDKDTSSMVVNSADRNGVTFYPTGNTPLRFNETENYFEIYNVAKQSWSKANTSNVTLGVWGNGAYYKTADGSYILVDGKTGEWGYLLLSTVSSGNMVVSANGEQLDYEVLLHTASGKEQLSTAADNFRKMYQGLLYASVEGATDLTEEEMAAFRATPDSECQLKLTITAADPDGTTRYTIYRFYRYSNLKSYMTVELVDSPDDPGDPQNGQGTFFVLSTFVEKLISDAQRVVDGQEVVATSKN